MADFDINPTCFRHSLQFPHCGTTFLILSFFSCSAPLSLISSYFAHLSYSHACCYRAASWKQGNPHSSSYLSVFSLEIMTPQPRGISFSKVWISPVANFDCTVCHRQQSHVLFSRMSHCAWDTTSINLRVYLWMHVSRLPPHSVNVDSSVFSKLIIQMVCRLFSSALSLHLPVKESLVITYHQNKTLAPAEEPKTVGTEGIQRWDGRDWRIHVRQEEYTLKRVVSALLEILWRPCKLSDKLRVLKATHTQSMVWREKFTPATGVTASLLCFMAFYSYVILSAMSHRV